MIIRAFNYFERDNEAYLKFTHEYDDEDKPDDIENYNLEKIDDIEFSRNPQCVYVEYDGEFDEWGINRDIE